MAGMAYFPRIRLWQLFALVTLAAVLVWLWPKVGFDVERRPGKGSRATIYWEEQPTELWDTFDGMSPKQVLDSFGMAEE